MHAAFAHLAEIEFRRFLAQLGRDAPMLREVLIEHNLERSEFIFCANFDNGQNWRSCWPRHEIARLGSSRGFIADERDFLQHCNSIYYRCYEDHLLNFDLRAARERVEEIIRTTTDREVIRRAQEEYLRHEEHLRRHHNIRRENPSFAVGEIARDFNFYPGALNYVRSPDEVSSIREAAAPRNMTATEVRAREAEALARHVRAMAARDYDIINWEALQVWIHPTGDVGTQEAQNKGIDLLKANLSPEQRAQYDKDKHFEVKGCDSGKRYRIRHGRQMNIDELDGKGKVVGGWCFLPEGGLVAGDCMLAQKIALESFERDALKIANKIAAGGVLGPGNAVGSTLLGT